MQRWMTRRERALLLACALLLVVAVVCPPLAQGAHYHRFADQRSLWGLPCAMDVLSNLPFALAGLAGGWMLWRLPAGALGHVERAMAALFFAGLLLTATGSGWYHLRPDDAGLAIDRVAMAVAMAGLLGLAVANRISERAGAALGLGVLLAGPLAVHVWAASGNLLPWAALQGGAMVLVLVLAFVRRRPLAPVVHWLPVVGIYALAKVLESADLAIYVFSGGIVSGHSLKHLVAALAAVPVMLALRALRRARQNAPARPATRTTGRRLARHG